MLPISTSRVGCGKRERKAKEKKGGGKEKEKKVLLINRGVGLRLPKDNTLSLPFGPGFLSRCPSLCPLLQEGELLWAVSPTPREAAGSGGLLAGGLF